jgi:hypothetical protein
MAAKTPSLAKGGIYRDQTLKAHSEVTSHIARYVADLREFDDKHSMLLFLASYYHDLGKGIFEKYAGNHKIQFERCLEELEKERLNIDEESRKIIAHLILRHHYTSKEDILKLSEIFVPADINPDVLLRMLRFCDHLASIENVNLAHLDELRKLGSPIEVFAYTISLEGLVAGKMMDLIDEVLKEENGKGIFYHNGSIFLFGRSKSPSFDSVKSKVESKLRTYFKNEIFTAESVIGVGDLGKTIIAPIDSLDSSNFGSTWKRIMDKFDKRRRPREDEPVDNAIDKAYKLIQCAVAEIFAHFEGSKYSLRSPKILLNPPGDIFSPVINDAEKRLGSAKVRAEFTSWSYEDITAIGEILQKYIEEKEKIKGHIVRDYSEQALKMSLQVLTFSGEKPLDVERFCNDWYNEYVQVANEKGIGRVEEQKEFCYICGYPTSFQFKEAISKKISISKIFSNRRPALALGIEPVKICPICLSEIKLLDSKLPAEELDSLLLVYLERPATVKPPYTVIKESFATAISDISEGTNLRGYLKTMQRMSILDEDYDTFNPGYALGTNHFYVMFLPGPERQFGIQATLFMLAPLIYRLVKCIGFSARMDIGSNMDYAPIQRLLEIPPISRQYTNLEDFWKEIVYPSEIWMNIQLGNIVQFVKQFPENWCHYFAKVLQEEERKVLSYVKEIYSSVKGVYGMKEKEMFDLAMKVSTTLRKRGYSRYAYTRPISIISSAILDAEKANFDENAIIEYATNRVLVLSSKEIGREIVKETVAKREEVKKEIYGAIENLTRRVYNYYKENGFKDFILLIRYISDAVYVESEFGGEESD